MSDDMNEVKGLIKVIGETHTAFTKTNDERLELMEKGLGGVAEVTSKLERIEKDLADAVDQKSRIEQLETAVRRGGVGEEVQADLNAEYKAALDIALRSNGRDDSAVRLLESKALAVESDPNGGYFVTPDTSGQAATRIFETSPIRALASVQTIGTDALEGAYDDDEAQALWAGETDPRPSTDTADVGKWRIEAHEIFANASATAQILEDANINIEEWILSKTLDRMIRSENAAFVSGNGSARPRGFLSYDDNTDLSTYTRNEIYTVGSGVVGGLDEDSIVDLIYSLKTDYRANAVVAASRLTWGEIRKIKDAEGRYLWQPGLIAGEPSTLLAIPTAEFNDMPDVAADADSLVIADWKKTYQIVDRLGMAVLRDPYTNHPFTKFRCRRRVGGAVVCFDSIVKMKIDS